LKKVSSDEGRERRKGEGVVMVTLLEFNRMKGKEEPQERRRLRRRSPRKGGLVDPFGVHGEPDMDLSCSS
jgi:hypothetical protein